MSNKKTTTFHVSIKHGYPDGRCVMSFIGPALYSRFQLRKALKRIRRNRPQATSARCVMDY